MKFILLAALCFVLVFSANGHPTMPNRHSLLAKPHDSNDILAMLSQSLPTPLLQLLPNLSPSTDIPRLPPINELLRTFPILSIAGGLTGPLKHTVAQLGAYIPETLRILPVLQHYVQKQPETATQKLKPIVEDITKLLNLGHKLDLTKNPLAEVSKLPDELFNIFKKITELEPDLNDFADNLPLKSAIDHVNKFMHGMDIGDSILEIIPPALLPLLPKLSSLPSLPSLPTINELTEVFGFLDSINDLPEILVDPITKLAKVLPKAVGSISVLQRVMENNPGRPARILKSILEELVKSLSGISALDKENNKPDEFEKAQTGLFRILEKIANLNVSDFDDDEFLQLLVDDLQGSTDLFGDSDEKDNSPTPSAAVPSDPEADSSSAPVSSSPKEDASSATIPPVSSNGSNEGPASSAEKTTGASVGSGDATTASPTVAAESGATSEATTSTSAPPAGELTVVPVNAA